MGFSKIRYNKEEIFRVKIEDDTGGLIENWVFMKSDFNKWVETMKKKFGISNKVERDLDWAY